MSNTMWINLVTLRIVPSITNAGILTFCTEIVRKDWSLTAKENYVTGTGPRHVNLSVPLNQVKYSHFITFRERCTHI